MAVIHYARTDEFWRRGQKYDFLDASRDVTGVDWRVIQPDANDVWLTAGMEAEFDTFLPIGGKETRAGNEERAIFQIYSRGVESTRDSWVFNFNSVSLRDNIELFIATYNSEVARWQDRNNHKLSVDSFVISDDTKIKWSSNPNLAKPEPKR